MSDYHGDRKFDTGALNDLIKPVNSVSMINMNILEKLRYPLIQSSSISDIPIIWSHTKKTPKLMTKYLVKEVTN